MKLTKKKQAYVATRKPEAIKGTALNNPAPLEIRYQKQLVALVKQMTEQTRREIERLFKHEDFKAYFGSMDSAHAMDATSPASQARILTDSLSKKFNELFGKKSAPLAQRMLAGADAASVSALHASLKQLSGGLNIKTNFLTGDLHQTLKASVTENVGLIKSISQEYLQKVQGQVMRSITSGNGLQDLVPALEKYEGMTIRRARNIATDQTRKAYNNLNRGRMEKAGVKKFEWLHTAGSQKPRQDHIELSGQIFSFDDLPVIDKNTGERGIPGQAVNCRCRMLPVVEFDTGEGGE